MKYLPFEKHDDDNSRNFLDFYMCDILYTSLTYLENFSGSPLPEQQSGCIKIPSLFVYLGTNYSSNFISDRFNPPTPPTSPPGKPRASSSLFPSFLWVCLQLLLHCKLYTYNYTCTYSLSYDKLLSFSKRATLLHPWISNFQTLSSSEIFLEGKFWVLFKDIINQ